MIPQLLTVQFHSGHGARRRLWVPLLPVVVVLSPVLVLALVALVVACLVLRVDPLRALSVGWLLVRSLSGTHVEIERGGRLALVTIR